MEKELDEVQAQLKSYETEDTSELSTLSDFDDVPNEFKKGIARKYINKIIIGEEEGLESITIQFKVKNINLSFFYDAKKGIIIDRFRPYLYITGKMLIKQYERSSDTLRWIKKEESINKVHQLIVEKSRRWRHLLNGNYNIEPPYMVYVPITVKSDGKDIIDESARYTFTLNT